MTSLLKKAFEEASQLPDTEQDTLAGWLLAEIEAERRWNESFAASPGLLDRLAAEALAEHLAGETEELDPEAL